MRITSKPQADELLELASKAQGQVKLCSVFGDVYNLRSDLSAYTAIAAMIDDHKDALYITCSEETDQLVFDKWAAKYLTK